MLRALHCINWGPSKLVRSTLTQPPPRLTSSPRPHHEVTLLCSEPRVPSLARRRPFGRSQCILKKILPVLRARWDGPKPVGSTLTPSSRLTSSPPRPWATLQCSQAPIPSLARRRPFGRSQCILKKISPVLRVLQCINWDRCKQTRSSLTRPSSRRIDRAATDHHRKLPRANTPYVATGELVHYKRGTTSTTYLHEHSSYFGHEHPGLGKWLVK